MINKKKFFYKARRYEDNKEVIGRVGSSHSIEDGKWWQLILMSILEITVQMQIGKVALLKQIQYSHINYNHKKEWFTGKEVV